MLLTAQQQTRRSRSVHWRSLSLCRLLIFIIQTTANILISRCFF